MKKIKDMTSEEAIACVEDVLLLVRSLRRLGRFDEAIQHTGTLAFYAGAVAGAVMREQQEAEAKAKAEENNKLTR